MRGSSGSQLRFTASSGFSICLLQTWTTSVPGLKKTMLCGMPSGFSKISFTSAPGWIINSVTS